VLKKVLESPERQLRIVGRQADGSMARILVRQVVADLAMGAVALRWQLGLGCVSERVTDREPEQHALDAGKDYRRAKPMESFSKAGTLGIVRILSGERRENHGITETGQNIDFGLWTNQ
jgi:hypothetical protein